MDEVYQELVLTDRGHIRLATLHRYKKRLSEDDSEDGRDDDIFVSLRVVNLHQCPPPYRTLSYVWGDADIVSEITCQGHPMSVTINLFSALKRIREFNEDVDIWIDAICINQNDLDERASQVAIMREIYQASQQTIADLGDLSTDKDELFALMMAVAKAHQEDPDVNRLWQENDLSALGIPPLTSSSWLAWQRLLSRPYFRRAWVLQEFAVPQNVIYHIGWTYFPVEDLESIALTLHIRGMGESQRPMAGSASLAQTASAGVLGIQRLSIARFWAQRSENDRHAALEFFLRLGRMAKSTDPKDKVYAVLGLAKDADLSDPALRVSYEPEETAGELFIRVAKYMIERSGAVAVQLLYEARGGRDSPVEGLPSWIPDWTNNFYDSRFGRPGDLSEYHSADERPINIHFDTEHAALSVDAAVVDELISLSPEFDPLKDTQSLSNIDAAVAVLVWVEAVMQMVSENAPQLHDSVKASTKKALARTLTAESIQNDPSLDSDLDHGFEAFMTYKDIALRAWREAREQGVAFMGPRDPEGVFVRAKQESRKFSITLSNTIGHARFAITRQGRTCIVASPCRQGDRVALVSGANLPFVVRMGAEASTDSAPTFWSLVGTCYVHGLMHNECNRDESIHWARLLLR